MINIKAGSTSVTIPVFIQDSASTTGAGKTGLAFNTSGWKAYYVKPGATPVAITLVTQTATGAWTSGGFCEIDATNMPGWYRLDVPNAALSTGSGTVVGISLSGATGAAPCNIGVNMVAYDPANSANLGLSSIGTYTHVDIIGRLPAALVGGRMDASVGAYAAGQDPAALVLATPANKLATDGTGRVTVGTNADKTGYSLSQSFPTNFSAMVLDANGRVQVQYGTSTGQINLTAGNLAGAVPSVTGAVGSVTGAVGSVTGAVGSVTGAVGSVTGNVGGNVAGSVGSVSSFGTLITDIWAAIPANLSNMAARFLTMIESYSSGTLWRFLTGALSQAPSGGGGGGGSASVRLLATPLRSGRSEAVRYTRGATGPDLRDWLTDASGNRINLTGYAITASMIRVGSETPIFTDAAASLGPAPDEGQVELVWPDGALDEVGQYKLIWEATKDDEVLPFISKITVVAVE